MSQNVDETKTRMAREASGIVGVRRDKLVAKRAQGFGIGGHACAFDVLYRLEDHARRAKKDRFP